MDKYKDYYNKWIDGILPEIFFWENSVMKSSGDFHDDVVRKYINDHSFRLENELQHISSAKDNKIKLLDVGSGPFSRCGSFSNKWDIEVVAVDPLASVYKCLKDRYNMNNDIDLRTGFVELLDKQFERNSFDMVHMSNSLDHSFDPIFGIYELLSVCKIGGIVVLRHHENEADNENYEGFHQWNLSLHNSEDSFVIWRKDERIDVCKAFETYAEFSLFPDLKETDGGWVYNEVIIRKKTQLELKECPFYYEFAERTFDKLLLRFLDESDRWNRLGMQDKYSRSIRERIGEWRLKPEQFFYKMKKNGWEKIDIYGAGKIGRELYALCNESGVRVGSIIDKKVEKCGFLPIVLLDKYEERNNDSAVIIDTVGLKNSHAEFGRIVVSINDII